MPRGRSEPAIEKFRRMLSRGNELPWRPVLLRDPCVYCAVWPILHREADHRTIEHIQPLSAGGANDWRNYASAHASCNENRGSAPLLKFFLYRQQVRDLQGRANKHARAKLRRRLLLWSGARDDFSNHPTLR